MASDTILHLQLLSFNLPILLLKSGANAQAVDALLP